MCIACSSEHFGGRSPAVESVNPTLTFFEDVKCVRFIVSDNATRKLNENIREYGKRGRNSNVV